MDNLIPKEVKVGGRTFKVKHPHYSRDNNWGLIEYNTSEIFLYQYAWKYRKGKRTKILFKPSKQNKEQTFIHEMLHGIDFVYNNDSLPETVTARLAEGLYQVLVDNFTIKAKGR